MAGGPGVLAVDDGRLDRVRRHRDRSPRSRSRARTGRLGGQPRSIFDAYDRALGRAGRPADERHDRERVTRQLVRFLVGQRPRHRTGDGRRRWGDRRGRRSRSGCGGGCAWWSGSGLGSGLGSETAWVSASRWAWPSVGSEAGSATGRCCGRRRRGCGGRCRRSGVAVGVAVGVGVGVALGGALGGGRWGGAGRARARRGAGARGRWRSAADPLAAGEPLGAPDGAGEKPGSVPGGLGDRELTFATGVPLSDAGTPRGSARPTAVDDPALDHVGGVRVDEVGSYPIVKVMSAGSAIGMTHRLTSVPVSTLMSAAIATASGQGRSRRREDGSRR